MRAAWRNGLKPGLLSSSGRASTSAPAAVRPFITASAEKHDAASGDGLLKIAPEAFKYVSMILNAKVYDVCIQSDLQHAKKLSAVTNNRVLLKREDQQKMYSSKLRGAYNKIVNLTPEEKLRGICACSSGNHAQGVAYAAAVQGVSAKIFMPKMASRFKVEAVQSLLNNQSEVLLTGDTFDDANAAALACVAADGRVLVHPFNDPLVIAGQGTIGQEILTQTTQEDVDAVFCCVGGGGMVAGIGVFLKSVKPSIKIIGVEAQDSAAMTESLKAGEMVELASAGLFADAASTRKVGDETFGICQRVVDEMVTVSTDELCAAIKDAFIDTRVVLEPAGALAVAGMKKYIREKKCAEKTFVAITSGANMDFDRLRFVSERSDYSETLVAVRIPERPGSFLELYRHIFPRNVTEFSYRIAEESASIFMSFQAKSDEDRQVVFGKLEVAGFAPIHLGENEMAKTHGRHLIGGRAPESMTESEVLLRFEFPNAPGSLLRFLEDLPNTFNVSLFHYRSHGADVGRVLVALQVPVKDRTQLREYLDSMTSRGYNWREETENEIYGHFLLEQVDLNTGGRPRPQKPPPLTFGGMGGSLR